ncbi:MAG TPA: hypothetical protein VHN15_11780, partial [Thermoanaerobaculia bacterium]|nr:hypothetical protein [Thermoanaerobaculia bacterium]
SFGFLWNLLDQQIGLPHDRLDLANLDGISLNDFQVLIFPSGSYGSRVDKSTRDALDAWVRTGGVLVAIGDAVGWLQDVKLTAIKSWEAPSEEDAEAAGPAGEDPESAAADAGGAGDGGSGVMGEVDIDLARRSIPTPGAIVGTQARRQHPLTLGLPSPPPVLVEGAMVLLPTGNPSQDVLLAADESPVISGFTWPEAEERLSGSLLVGMESRGNGGVVVFAQEPTFRLFWRGTMPIFLNAVVFGPSTGVGGNS